MIFWGEISVSDRNVKSKKYSVCQINMDPKNNSSVIHIRETSVCNYCGLKLYRHAHKMQNARPITLTFVLLKITYWLCNILCRLLTFTCWLLTSIYQLHTFTYNSFLAAHCYMLAAYYYELAACFNFLATYLLLTIDATFWLGMAAHQDRMDDLFQQWLAEPLEQPRLAARFEIGWQPRYQTTILFLSLIETNFV